MRHVYEVSNVAFIIFLLGAPANSDEAKVSVPPTEGKTHYELYLTDTPLRRLDWPGVGGATVIQANGITRNIDGQSMFDQMAMTCLYNSVVVPGTTRVLGSCSYMDRDGDQAFTIFMPGKISYVGGTGKYAGLQGDGTFKSVPLKGPAETGARISTIEVSWSYNK